MSDRNKAGIERLIDTFEQNFKLTRLYSSYLETCPKLITAEMVNELTEGGDLSRAPSYLVRNPTLAPQLEKTHETPPSSRDEGLLFLHGLESNLEASLQTPQEA